jgi:hypothetical protein
MTKPMVRIHNTETNEIIDREMNTEEFIVWERGKLEAVAREKQIQAQLQARQIILDRLGITAEEAALLLQ